MGFYQSWHDYSLFVKKQDEVLIILQVYVDNILLISNQASAITEVKNTLHVWFKINDLVLLSISLEW